MKRYGDIYPKIYTIENLRLAFNEAKKDKSYYTEVVEIEKDIDYYLYQIQEMLINKTYSVSSEDYVMFTKNDKGKIREIFKLDFFPHRIVQWALLLQIQDILYKDFIDQTYSSIPKRGIHSTLKKLDYDLKNNVEETQFCLKMDVKKFYPSINHEINKRQYRRKFKDKDLLWLIDMLIDSLDTDEVKYGKDAVNKKSEDKAGIAIGSLFSQWDGNFYLSPMGHWLKEVKKVKFLYIYCDDIVILGETKEELHELRKDIEEYLWTNLKLELKDNYQVFPVDVRGIDYVGYRHFRSHILLRKSTATTMKRKMTRLLTKCKSGGSLTYSEWCSINSYKGWLIWANCHNLYVKYIKPLEMHCEEFYNIEVKPNKKKYADISCDNMIEFKNKEGDIIGIFSSEVVYGS